ncbi:pimeloyl-ACP methyl ester carboxylesterase [Brevundimonas alba]|uniref:Pimeloyl-ACP methyl ester carboxylesterase n=1 Tax=Brevundimonas alba TaxID=74314 RepID=A0A7X5YK92_9CAUL|nr:alpha/beta hydrolase [Brevundimonas alba]NJC40015.1 pimeloyl-ACP methyl ester carboxylesterase [Brevundimonas alba]
MVLFAFLQRILAIASIAVFAVAAWLLWSWYDAEHVAETLNLAEPSNARLWWGGALMAFSLLGRTPMLMLLGRGGTTAPARRAESVAVAGADGSVLHVEVEGAMDGPILVFSHGWGLSARIWAEARADLGKRFGLVFWDLPGLGRSGRPTTGYSVEAFAEDLHAVVDSLPEHRPVILVGHSIGGMIVQTFCARHPELLNHRIAGIVLENTTHTNPLTTMVFSRVLTPLQPLIEFACKLETFVSPLTWAMNWQAYLSGSSHVAARVVGFGTRPMREHLERTTRLITKNSPAVQALGNIAMCRWSVTDRLANVDVPALVFVGGRDLITKDHAGETIAEALPQGRLVRVEDAGHMGPVEKAAFYNEQIGDFAEFVRLLRSRAPAPTRRSFLSPDADLAPPAQPGDGPMDKARPATRTRPAARPI